MGRESTYGTRHTLSSHFESSPPYFPPRAWQSSGLAMLQPVLSQHAPMTGGGGEKNTVTLGRRRGSEFSRLANCRTVLNPSSSPTRIQLAFVDEPSIHSRTS